MITDVYAHILDEDRKVNAQRFEAGFYGNPDLRSVERSIRERSAPLPSSDLAQILLQLQERPELVTC